MRKGVLCLRRTDNNRSVSAVGKNACSGAADIFGGQGAVALQLGILCLASQYGEGK